MFSIVSIGFWEIFECCIARCKLAMSSWNTFENTYDCQSFVLFFPSVLSDSLVSCSKLFWVYKHRYCYFSVYVCEKCSLELNERIGFVGAEMYSVFIYNSYPISILYHLICWFHWVDLVMNSTFDFINKFRSFIWTLRSKWGQLEIKPLIFLFFKERGLHSKQWIFKRQFSLASKLQTSLSWDSRSFQKPWRIWISYGNLFLNQSLGSCCWVWS